jgi:adenylate cyclase
MFEAAVLFTDIRGSSRLIRELPPREFFLRLNQVLSAQTKQISRFEGSVIKYTGDGVMAIFRGMGRSYMALRCGLELASMSHTQELPFGIGIAEGLVLAGLIGDSNHAGQRHQYDVISATVNLASRLCGLAGEGEVMTTRNIEAAARFATPVARPIDGVAIRGFDRKIDCVAFNPAR